MHGAWCALHAALDIYFSLHSAWFTRTDAYYLWATDRSTQHNFEPQHTRSRRDDWGWGGRSMRMCMHRDRMAARKEAETATGSAPQPR